LIAGGRPGRIILLISWLIVPVMAQRQSFKFYGQDQGLSNLATECLFQDRGGYLWVGTQNGLFRYDGAVFTHFGEAEGLPSSSVDAIVETPDGVLWVGTSRGLARRRGSRFEAFDFGERVESSGRFGLAADGEGRLYLTTIAGLLVSSQPIAGVQRKFEAAPGPPTGPAYGVYADRNGVVWYGCASAVCRLMGGKVTIYGTKEGVPADRWDALLADRSGTVWIRSSKHLLKRPRGGNGFEGAANPIPPIGDFGTLHTGRDGELFVPTDDGIWELSNGRWRGIGRQQGLIASATSSVLQDREGSLWIGLWGTGLARWVGRNQWEGWTHADGLSGEHVWKMTRDREGRLWVATDNGVSEMRIDPETQQPIWRVWTEKDGLPSNKTRAIALAPDGGVWTGSSPGAIARIDPRTGKVKSYSLPGPQGSDRIWTLAFDRAGTLWVSTRGGLFYSRSLNGQTTFQRQDLPMGDAAETVSATLEDRQGRLWVAGTKGLARRENGVWKRFTKADGLPTTAVGFVADGHDGSIWLSRSERRVQGQDAGRPAVGGDTHPEVRPSFRPGHLRPCGPSRLGLVWHGPRR